MKLVKLKFKAIEAGKFKVDAGEIEVPENLEAQVEGFIRHIQDAAALIADQAGQLQRKDGEIAGLKAQVTEAQDNPEKLDALAKEREEVLYVAEANGFKKDEMRPLKSAEIKLKVVAKRLGASFKSDGADPNFIEGVWASVKADAEKTKTNTKKQAQLSTVTSPQQPRGDDAGDGGEQAPTYAQVAHSKVDGLHALSEAEIAKRGLN